MTFKEFKEMLNNLDLKIDDFEVLVAQDYLVGLDFCTIEIIDERKEVRLIVG